MKKNKKFKYIYTNDVWKITEEGQIFRTFSSPSGITFTIMHFPPLEGSAPYNISIVAKTTKNRYLLSNTL